MYLLTHSLSPVLVLVAVMDPKVLKTKISHTHSLILSQPPSLTLKLSASFELVSFLRSAISCSRLTAHCDSQASPCFTAALVFIGYSASLSYYCFTYTHLPSHSLKIRPIAIHACTLCFTFNTDALIRRCELISALKDLEQAHIIGRAQSHQLQQTKKELAAQSQQIIQLQKEISILRQPPKVALGHQSSTTTTTRSDGTKLVTKTILPYVTVNGVRAADRAALVNENGNLQSAGVGGSTINPVTRSVVSRGVKKQVEVIQAAHAEQLNQLLALQRQHTNAGEHDSAKELHDKMGAAKAELQKKVQALHSSCEYASHPKLVAFHKEMDEHTATHIEYTAAGQHDLAAKLHAEMDSLKLQAEKEIEVLEASKPSVWAHSTNPKIKALKKQLAEQEAELDVYVVARDFGKAAELQEKIKAVEASIEKEMTASAAALEAAKPTRIRQLFLQSPPPQFTVGKEFDRSGNLQSVKVNGEEIVSGMSLCLSSESESSPVVSDKQQLCLSSESESSPVVSAKQQLCLSSNRDSSPATASDRW